MPGESKLPPTLEETFEDVVGQYRGALSPGAETRLRAQTLAAHRRGDVRLVEDVASALIAFLQGDDHRKATQEGDPDKMQATDPGPFFVPGKEPAPDVPLRAVLKRIGNLKPGAAGTLEAELGDSCFGLDHRETTKRVVQHLRQRENHRHLVKQPPMPHGEARVREALEPYAHLFVPGKLEETAIRWGASMARAHDQVEINERVARSLSDPMVARGRLIDDRPAEIDWRDERFRRVDTRREDRDIQGGLIPDGRYRT